MSFLIPFFVRGSKHFPNYLIWHNQFHYRVNKYSPQQEAWDAFWNSNANNNEKFTPRPAVSQTSTRHIVERMNKLRRIDEQQKTSLDEID